MGLKGRITNIHEVKAGEGVSYAHTFVADRPTRVATIPIGYADGIIRKNTGRDVFINNKRYPIVGNICMDSLMVDVSKCNANVGDKVYIWENNLIKLEDVSSICNTINYEILCNVGNRVKRKYIKE